NSILSSTSGTSESPPPPSPPTLAVVNDEQNAASTGAPQSDQQNRQPSSSSTLSDKLEAQLCEMENSLAKLSIITSSTDTSNISSMMATVWSIYHQLKPHLSDYRIHRRMLKAATDKLSSG